MEQSRGASWPRMAVTTVARVAAVTLALMVTGGSDTKLVGRG